MVLQTALHRRTFDVAGGRVAVEHHEIGQLSRLKRTNQVIGAQDAGVVDSGPAKAKRPSRLPSRSAGEGLATGRSCPPAAGAAC